MENDESQTFLTALPNDKQTKSILINDEDDIDIDVKSSADSDGTHLSTDEIANILNKNSATDHTSSILIPNSINDVIQDKMSHDDPSPSAVGEHLQTVIPRAVYDYAALYHEKLETPRQTKLSQDVNAVLGSNDPPAGFGFLHPRFYFLEQKRPVPMEPLRVWRGYNGHVYFSPIQVQPLESDRHILPTKSRKLSTVKTLTTSAKLPQRARTDLSAYKNRKSSIYKSLTNKDRINNERSLTSHRISVRRVSNENELKHNTLATFCDVEENKNHINEDKTKMWRSVVTCVPVQIKPMSKRSQHTIEDLHALQQEQIIHDPLGYHRQVLPNIRPLPKSKFLYKGLAYKEVKKVPGIVDDNDENGNLYSLKKPLIDYNLTQAYIRYEVNAERAKQTVRPPPPPPPTTSTVPMKDHQLIKNPTSLDIREIRKRIVKGTTLAYRPAQQSAKWAPGRPDSRSGVISENVQLRPSTSKSSIPLKQSAPPEMPILTKYVHRPRTITRQTPSTDLIINAS